MRSYKLRRAAERLRSQLSNKVAILLYHRIVDLTPDPWSLCVTPRHFSEQLQVLKKFGRVMRLQELITALGRGRLPKRAVVITFDDGYADNFSNTRLILERHGLPATVFVATGQIESDREFWWDELDKLFLQPRALPQTLDISINGRTLNVDLADTANYGESDYNLHRGWKNWEKPPSQRQSLYREVYQLLWPLAYSDRRAALDQLFKWAGAATDCRASHRPLSTDEIIGLARDGLIEVGSHTVTHSALSRIPLEQQRDEIQKSKHHLEELVNLPVSSFAYPYGRQTDYTDETIALVKDSGFVGACSNYPGTVGRGTDPYQLPRLQVMDWDGDECGKRLSAWFES